MPGCDHLPYNEVCFKATHNSYDRDGLDLGTQLTHDAAAPHRCGCRGLELDLYQDSEIVEFWVSHESPLFSSHWTPLRHFLGQLAAWSDRHGNDHEPVTVTVDLKKMRGEDHGWVDLFDGYLRDHFPTDRLFSPGAFLADDTNLVRAVHRQGWPTIGDLRGKFLFVLSGTEKRKQVYARDPARRLCFADRLLKPFDPEPATTQGNRIFLNFAMSDLDEVEDLSLDPEFDAQKYNRVFARIVNETRYVTRGFGLNNREKWRRSGKLGVNIRATDEAAGASWARVAATPLARRSFVGI